MKDQPDVEAVPTDVDDERIIAALEGNDPEIAPRLALRALAQRQSQAAVGAMARLARDRRVSTALRVDAARNLGRRSGEDRQETLVALLRDRDPAVVAAAADSLGLIGDVRALSQLEALAPVGRDPTGQRIRFARTLLSYRLGVGSHLVTPPNEAELVAVGPQAVEIEQGPAPRDLAGRAADDVAKDLPTLSLVIDQAQVLTCFGTDLLLAPTEHAADADRLNALDQRNAIPAVLLRRWDCPERWAPSLLLLSHPQDEGDPAALLAMRPGGTLVGAGKTSRQRGGRSFQLRSLRSGYFPPVEVDGSFTAEAGFLLERALSAGTIDRQVRARTPRRAS